MSRLIAWCREKLSQMTVEADGTTCESRVTALAAWVLVSAIVIAKQPWSLPVSDLTSLLSAYGIATLTFAGIMVGKQFTERH